ncbi:hypothetical protein Terro_1282 [Terriglobus roseus DSM 18391]|uniref:Uncharacterized protein n=1 Tax=Terriglobus roseus (strain DSM 18391 / NRRL B-41598 / KBS 63) TaxID=926566 RepID=I3ZEC3_TERRK|nr:hypothetical protein [Terriglobus roseus]AFL87591.1 hypothetical protein Terro_1282 [Terriglobus roseus DSM 18391]
MKLLAILLLMLMGLPMASPLLALTTGSDDHLPACCRRNGKHHCLMATGSSDASTGTHIRAKAEKCPMYPQASVAAPHDVATPPAEQAIYASIVSHPTGIAQTESKWRVARYRSRQKRGPPVSIFL